MRKLVCTLAILAMICFCASSTLAGPIHQAAARGDVAKVSEILKEFPSLAMVRDERGATPLHWAADTGQTAVARVLVEKGADVNTRKPNGVAPLHIAASLGHAQLAELLIEKGADVNARDHRRRTPLSLARENGHTAIADLLIARGADVSVSEARRQITSTASWNKPVKFMSATVRGCPVNMIFVRLDDVRVRLEAAVSRGGIGSGESFGSFIQRLNPIAAINATFFCKTTWKPIGDIVVNGRLANFGGMGTGLCITEDNQVEFIIVRTGRHTDWGKYKTVICCGPRLLVDGSVWVQPQAEGFSDSHVLGIGRRTAVGLTNRNRLLLLNTRKACSLKQLAHIMKDIGCTDAINFDGGSSTAMYYRGKTVTSPGRRLTNLLLVFEDTHPPHQAKGSE